MKKLQLTLMACLVMITGYAQQANYNWRIGVSGGFSNYYGDLSPYPIANFGDVSHALKLFTYNDRYAKDFSGEISLERKLTNTLGLKAHYGMYNFGMSDQYILPDGKVYDQSPNFNRALNFNTSAEEAGLSLVIRSDNGKLLGKNAFLAPYLTLGGGYMWYSIKGDLLDAEGNQYDYASGPVILDGNYETDLAKLNTETGDKYELNSLFASIGLGVKIRLSNKFELFAQSTVKRAFSDQLDDVAGLYRPAYDDSFVAYAAQPNQRPDSNQPEWRGNSDKSDDWNIYHGAGIKFSFGAAKNEFRAPSISSTYSQYQPKASTSPLPKPVVNDIPQPKTEKFEIEKEFHTGSPSIINNYYTYLNGKSPFWNYTDNQMAALEVDMAILEQEKLRAKVGRDAETSKAVMLGYQETITKMEADTSLTNAQQGQLRSLKQSQFQEQLNLDSLDQEKVYLDKKIDKLEEKKALLLSTGMNDSIPFNASPYFNQVPVFIPQTVYSSSQNPAFGDSAVYSRTLIGSTDTMAGAYPSPPVYAYGQEEYSQAPLTSSSQASTPTGYSSQEENSYNGGYQGRSLESESGSSYRQGDYKSTSGGSHNSWIPVPIIFSGNGKKSKNVPEDAITESTAAPAGNWYDLVSAEDYQNYYLPAMALGMTTAGLYIAADKPAQAEQPLAIGESSAQPASPALAGSISPVGADTVFVTGEDREILIPSKTAIYFDTNQKTFTAQEQQKLIPLVNWANQHAESQLFLEGFADQTGNLSYNQNLISLRIEAVKSVLMTDYGIKASQILTSVGGQIHRKPDQSKPLSSDRKVEVAILTKQ